MPDLITLEEAKLYLRVDTPDDNTLIGTLAKTAENIIEKFTGRVLMTRIFELVFDSAGDSIEISKSPLQEVVRIETIDAAGVKTEVSRSLYDVDTSGIFGRIKLKAGCVWPSHRGFASFIITVKAGYGDTADAVPAPLRQAALLALAILYETRGAMNEDVINAAISGLCRPYRIVMV